MRFQDRREAGHQLGRELRGHRSGPPPVILGLPQGGVPVAAEVAAVLGGVLDVFVARKIGAPGREELGIGAVAEGSDEAVFADTAPAMGFDHDTMDELAAQVRDQVAEQVRRIRGDRPLPDLSGREVILVDDGITTGVTAEAAVRALRGRDPARLVLAVPVCPPETRTRLSGIADEVVALKVPARFGAVGSWYETVEELSDQDIEALLSRARSMA